MQNEEVAAIAVSMNWVVAHPFIVGTAVIVALALIVWAIKTK